MTDELQTNTDRDPQKEGGRVQAGDGHALAEQAREQAKAEDEQDGQQQDQDGQDGQDDGGQVSSVQNMDDEKADVPISDSQSVAGQPEGESGRVDEGPTGPNSRGGSNRN